MVQRSIYDDKANRGMKLSACMPTLPLQGYGERNYKKGRWEPDGDPRSSQPNCDGKSQNKKKETYNITTIQPRWLLQKSQP